MGLFFFFFFPSSPTIMYETSACLHYAGRHGKRLTASHPLSQSSPGPTKDFK